MNQRNKQKLKNFYEDHLHEVILRFWLTRAVDHQYGGCYTCFDNRGRRLQSTDKFVWSQGRFVWILAELTAMYPDNHRYPELAKAGVDFLLDHAFLNPGSCGFLLTEAGELKEIRPGDGHDVSFYADCFVVMGLAKYARVTGETRPLNRAARLYDSILQRIGSGSIRTEPYPVPRGYKMHGVPMITLNTGQELEAAMRASGDRQADRIQAQNSTFVDEIMTDFVHRDCLLEMVDTNGQPVNSILGRFVNPGHTVEDMWFIMHHGKARNDRRLITTTGRLIRTALALGWDQSHGGLLQYVDKNGGPPTGSRRGLENEVMVKKVEQNWDCKLWWPHSEALYACLLAYHLTGDSRHLHDHDRIFDYTFQTFPNPDPEIGEWIQIRDRQGRPADKITALPVKDPYHVTRNLLLMIQLLSEPDNGT